MRWFSTACFAAAIVCLVVFLSDAHSANHNLSQANRAAQQAERQLQRAQTGLEQSQAAVANLATGGGRKLGNACSTANGSPGIWVQGTGGGLSCFAYADTQTVP